MSLWEAKDFARDGAILGRAVISDAGAELLESGSVAAVPRDVVAYLAAAESGVYLTRDDVAKLRDACDQLLAGGAP